MLIRSRKLDISIVFITQSYVRLNFAHFFITKIPNERELQQIALNHSSDISAKDTVMTITDQIRDEKLQNDIDKEAAKISALSSGKIHKYEYLTCEEILPSNQPQIIEQAKFTYSPLGRAFEKQKKQLKIKEKNK